MGRRERELEQGPLFEFATDLRQLRAQAGMTYRALAGRAGYSASALSAAANGESLPSLDVTRAYVGACGGDEAEWERRWRDLAADLRRTHPGLLPDPVTDAAAEVESQPVPAADDEREGADGPAPLSADDPRRIGPVALAARLGAGAMGRVYLGRTADGEPVAVKAVRPELAEDCVFRHRFRRELQTLRGLTGPFTGRLVDGDAEPASGPPWLATAFTPALTLAEAVDSHGPLPPQAGVRIAAALATALTDMHAPGSSTAT
ncbi:helix-turn-helix domain-containing protein [Streptomyces sp. NPDC007851]|uniref:helix-turn-helix domain-containing protein n=1 Tax=Streptomyces sp. NPDC007851 TaxID=3155008 RepID=UPI0033DEF0E9